jgi:hypothetical protein
MTNFEKPLDFSDLRLSGAHRTVAAVKTAIVLALLIAYSLGFAALCPLAQRSAAESAAEGNDPMLFVGS